MLSFFIVQLSHPYITTGKTRALTRWNFVGKVMSLLFNMLSRLDITFLPRSRCLLISWLQSPSAVILEPKKLVCHCFHCFPIYLPWSDWNQLYVYIYPLPLGPAPPSHPCRSAQSTELSSLHYTAGSDWLFYVWQCINVTLISQFIPQQCLHLCSRRLCLYSCSANGFICTTFLDSTYMH